MQPIIQERSVIYILKRQRPRWFALVFDVGTLGDFGDNAPINNYGLRPVINIRSDVTISGDGTMESPYTIS